MKHGAVVIAAITSCTNTSNPSVMLAAGLLAKNAVAKGLKVKPYVKTSLAPGSRVVTDYFEKAGVTDALNSLGFETVGYGCTTCIGNSGPLPDPVAKAVTDGDLVAAAVLSGNRNFEGRVNPLVKANYLASPPLVVAYALAGTTDIDLTKEPLGKGRDGKDVYLKDIWPTREQVAKTVTDSVTPDMFQSRYGSVWDSNPKWNAIKTTEGDLYDWHPDSTYIQEPPFLIDLPPQPGPIQPIRKAPLPGGARRFGDDRSYFARRFDLGERPGRKISDRARRAAGRFQQLRRSPRQRSRDDSRHVCQHSHPQSTGAGNRRGRHSPLAGRPADEHLRRGDEVQSGKRAASRAGRRGIRHRLQPRLGRQRHDAAGREAPCWPPASNASIAATWSAWACCRCNFCRVKRGNRSG